MKLSNIYIAITSIIAGVKIREMFSKETISSKLSSAVAKLQQSKSARDKSITK